MPFSKFMEIGRVCFGTNGPLKGKFFAIVDIIDYNRALIDGPCSGVERQECRFMNLRCTHLKIKIQHGQRAKGVKKAWEVAEIEKLSAELRANLDYQKRMKRKSLTDFEHFRVARIKCLRNKMLKRTFKASELPRDKDGKAITAKTKKAEKRAKKRASKPSKPVAKTTGTKTETAQES